MKATKPSYILLILTVLVLMMPFTVSYADTAYGAELVLNGDAELSSTSITSYWNDDTGASRWGASGYWEGWPPAAVGDNYFFLYNSGLTHPLTGTMSQWINLYGTEGSGLFAAIAEGDVSLQLSGYMYQSISADNQAKVILEEYNTSNTLLQTTNLVNATASGNAMGFSQTSGKLNPNTRKFKVLLYASLTNGGYAEFDEISLKLSYTYSGRAPVFGSDFPTSGTTTPGTTYSHAFTITDPDAGDIDIISFSADSANTYLVPNANVGITGSGTNRTLNITPSSALSGDTDITVTAADATKNSSSTIHLTVTKVISMDTNLVENGNGTYALESWSGYYDDIYAIGSGFSTDNPSSYMFQDIDISKYVTLISGGATNFQLSAAFPDSYGEVTAQFYYDSDCVTPVGSVYRVNAEMASLISSIPSSARSVSIQFNNTSSTYDSITVQNISFIIKDDFPKISDITDQTTSPVSLTVPVYAYYTTASATLSAVSDDQTIIPDSGITVGGSGFNRSLTFTPLKGGTATVTVTLNDGVDTATTTFDVIVREPTAITGVDPPTAGYYATSGNMDFVVHFNRDVTGGSGTTLPLTIGGVSVNAAYETSSLDTITYRYTVAESVSGTVAVGTAISDSGSSILDTDGYAPSLEIPTTTTSTIVLAPPVVTSSASGDSTTYGTPVTFTASLTSADTLAGTIQFKADGVDLGSPVTVSANEAQYTTSTDALDTGDVSVTAEYVPSGTDYHFTSLTGSAYELTVNPKSVSITGLVAEEKTYDGTTDVSLSGGTLTGTLSGDSVSAVCPTSGTAAQKNAGTHSVTFDSVTLSGDDQANYTISVQPSVSVVISPKSVTPSPTVSDKAYDGTTTATVSGVAFDGLISGETLAIGVDYTATGVFDSADVGTDIRVTVTVSLSATTAAGNYTLSSETAYTTADITQGAVTITGVTATDRGYDGTVIVTLSGGTLSGVQPGDAANVGFDLHTGAAENANVGLLKPVTTAVTLNGSKAVNYTLTQPTDVTVNITKSALTLSSAAVSDKVYDGTADATVTDVTFDGLVTGETLALGVDYTASGAFESVDVGADIPVTVTVTLGGTVKALNYTLPSNTVDTAASITQGTASLSGVTAANRSYDGTIVVALSGGVLAGVETADAADVGFDLHSGTVTDANAGTGKAVTTAITLTGAKGGNYTLTQPTDVTVDISQATLTLHGAVVDNKIYDGTADATVTDVTFNGLMTGETLTIGTDYSATGVFDSPDIGTAIPVTVTVMLATTDTANNYTLSTSTVDVAANITEYGVTVTGVEATDRAYDGTTAVALTGGVLNGVHSGDEADVGFVLNAGTMTDSNAGNSKAVTTAITLNGSKAGNYSVTQPADVTVDIAQATLTVHSAAAEDKVYDGTTNAIVTDVTLDGLITGETLLYGVDNTAAGVFSTADVGSDIPVTVTVTMSDTATAANYTVSGSGSTTADITPLTITGVAGINVENGVGDEALIDSGDRLTADTSGVTVPGTLTINYQWYRNGTAIPGATASVYTVGSLSVDPVGTVLTVVLSGTGNYTGTLTSTAVTVHNRTLGGSISISGVPAPGNVLTLDVSLLTPSGATYDISWLREGVAISSATAAEYTVVDADQGKTLRVVVTANGYYTGTLAAEIAVPERSPYIPEAGIDVQAGKVDVDLTLGSTLISSEQLTRLIAYNADRPIILYGDGYTITFPAGSMHGMSGPLDIGIQFNTGAYYGVIQTAAGDSFVRMLAFNHSGSLPGEACVRIYVGTQYAGQTMRYLYYNPTTGTLELMQLAVVDASGYVAVTQDHCSSYSVARYNEAIVPQTGDQNINWLWWLLATVSFSVLAMLLWLGRKNRRSCKRAPKRR